MSRAARQSLLSWGAKPQSASARRAHGFFMLTLAVALIHLVVFASMQIPLLQTILGYQSTITVDQVYTAINAQRIEQGLDTLQLDTNLSAAAYAKAQDMLQKGYWSHTSPEGKEPWNFITENGYSYQVAGENLARNFSTTAPMIEAWQASPTHNANLSSSAYSETGIAVLQGEMDGVPTTLVVQLFAAPQTPENTGSLAQAQTLPADETERRNQTPPSPATPAQTGTETGTNAETPGLVGPARVIGPEQEALLGAQANRQQPSTSTIKPILSPLDLYRGGTGVALVGVGGLLVRDFRQKKKGIGKHSGSKHLAHFFLLIGVLFALAVVETGSLL